MTVNYNVFALTQRYGAVPGQAAKNPSNRYAKALLVVVGGDGTVSDKEWAALEDTARFLGHSAESIADLRQFDWKKADLREMLKEIPDPQIGRRLLYDAVLIASVDGYAEGERAAARKMAERLGVDAPTLSAIEAMVEAESALRVIRRSWFEGPK
jgi:tellurite resistance protein